MYWPKGKKGNKMCLFKHVYYNRYNSHLTSFVLLPSHNHVHWATSLYLSSQCTLAHLPSSTFKSILTEWKWISIIYTNVGYARSLQLPATVHRNEEVIEKCHSNSALRKERGHLKKKKQMDKIRPRDFRGNGTYRKWKHFFVKQMEQHCSWSGASADQLSHDICTLLIGSKSYPQTQITWRLNWVFENARFLNDKLTQIFFL